MEKGWFVFVIVVFGGWKWIMGLAIVSLFFMGYDYYYLLFENEKDELGV
jgi:hypothetical protein